MIKENGKADIDIDKKTRQFHKAADHRRQGVEERKGCG